jgi:hypothetical protein
MKCIKEKCRFCIEHDYYCSYYKCYLCNFSFLKDLDTECLIEKELEKIQKRYKNLSRLRNFINREQEE